jgi:hypothetical protein
MKSWKNWGERGLSIRHKMNAPVVLTSKIAEFMNVLISQKTKSNLHLQKIRSPFLSVTCHEFTIAADPAVNMMLPVYLP